MDDYQKSVTEYEVLQLVAAGCENTEIAAQLVIAPTTVQNHLRSIFQKLGVTNRTAAARNWWEVELGLSPLK